MTRPRILVVGPPLAMGGTERHLTQVLPVLAHRGIDVHLHVLERGGALEPIIAESGVPIEGPAAGHPRAVRAGHALFGLLARLRALRPSLVHLFLPEPVLIGSIAARIIARPRIVVSRRSLSHYRNSYPAIGALERLATRHADALIGNSHAVVAQLMEEAGDASKVGLIHNGVRLPEPITQEERAQRRARIGVSPDAHFLVVNANLIPYKGHADLVAALALAAPRLPMGWRVALIGRDHGIGCSLDMAMAEAGLEHAMLLVGCRNDAPDIVAAADIAILPSHEEGFSNALIEGMAAGVPSIATCVGGNADAIEHMTNGLLVPSQDPPALAAAIARLTEDRSFANRIGAAGRARVADLFTEEKMLQGYYRLWSQPQLIGKKPVADILEGKGM